MGGDNIFEHFFISAGSRPDSHGSRELNWRLWRPRKGQVKANYSDHLFLFFYGYGHKGEVGRSLGDWWFESLKTKQLKQYVSNNQRYRWVGGPLAPDVTIKTKQKWPWARPKAGPAINSKYSAKGDLHENRLLLKKQCFKSI